MEEIKYDNKNLCFLHGGREVDTKVRINDIADKDDKETNKLNILVYDQNTQISSQNLKK